MYNAKLIQLLKKIDKKELKEFTSYLNGLYSKHSFPLTLFEHIAQYHPDYTHKKLDLDYIASTVFDKQKPKRISNEANKILNWLKEFLVWNHLQKSKRSLKYQQILLEEYRSRELESFMKKTLNSIDTQLENATSFGDMLSSIEIYHQAYFERLSQEQKIDRNYLNQLLSYTETLHELIQLKYTSEAIVRKQVFGEDEPKILEISTENSSNIILDNYRNLYTSIRTSNLVGFRKGIAFFKENVLNTPIDEQRFMIACLISGMAKPIREGNLNYIEIALDLYLFGLDNQILITGGYITNNMFSNIVSLAIAARKHQFAHNFVEKYSKYLDPKLGGASK